MKRVFFGAVALAAAGASAHAQPITGLYVGAGIGANYNQDRNERIRVFNENVSINLRSDIGLAAVGSVGWGFGNGVRAEVEANFRWNEVNRISAAGLRGPNVSGSILQYGVMANALYDLPVGLTLGGFAVTPYVGVGAGYVWSDAQRVRSRATGGGLTGTIGSNDQDGRFAYQAILGASVGLDSVAPGLALTMEYRFLGTLAPSLGVDASITNGVDTLSGRIGTFQANSYNHSVLVGLRYAFNTPAPAPVVAPAPAPAPAPARTFLVFFDWDRADLTDRARQIIAEAATNARTVSSTRIEVSGHADRTGGAAYNQRLSVRRAEAVAAELVRRGINRNEITIQGFGFERPLVPTAQGVREPQNRRVEIVLR